MGTPRIDDSWGKPNGRIDVAGTPGSPTIRWRARYIGFNRWVQAVRQAGTTDIDARPTIRPNRLRPVVKDLG
jgi:hypothetical protein